MARQFQWGWVVVNGPQMQHYPNVTPGLNDLGIHVFLAEFRQILGAQLQRPGDSGTTLQGCTEPLEVGQTCR